MHYFLKNYIHTSQYYTLPLVIFQGDKLKILHKIIAGYLVVLTEKEEDSLRESYICLTASYEL